MTIFIGVGLTLLGYGLWFHEWVQIACGGIVTALAALIEVLSQDTWKEQK